MGLTFIFMSTYYMLIAELSLFTCFMSSNQSMMGQNQTKNASDPIQHVFIGNLPGTRHFAEELYSSF